MKPKKPKKKEVTMWAIWSPYHGGIQIDTFSFLMKNAWVSMLSTYMDSLTTKKSLIKLGYRAVKGKFVWEEK